MNTHLSKTKIETKIETKMEQKKHKLFFKGEEDNNSNENDLLKESLKCMIDWYNRPIGNSNKKLSKFDHYYHVNNDLKDHEMDYYYEE